MRHALAFLAFALGAALLLAACESSPTSDAPPDHPPATLEKAPEYAAVASLYNARVDALVRLQSQVSVVIESETRDKGHTREQLEGNLIIERPLNVALRLDKVGQPVAHLGSNDHAYWWLNLAEDEPSVAVGSHIKATPKDAETFGLPVHPLEFVELLGITPLPAAAPASKIPPVAWSKDGKSLIVTLPSRWGTRRLTIDPATTYPSRVELLAANGSVAATADLSRYQPVNIDTRPGAPARVASNISLTVPTNSTRMILVLADPKSPAKVRAKAFDLVPLVENYNIKKFIDLDARKTPSK